MPRTIAIVSDIHYAGEAEQARGSAYEFRGINNPLARLLLWTFRYFVWQREPLGRNYLLERFLIHASNADYVIANGDYSCNSGFVGISDDAAFQSAQECLGKLRKQFGAHLRATFGDHELGKIGFFNGQGGMRMASWRRARAELGLESFWKLEIGRYVLLGVTSSLIALPVFQADTLPAELQDWQQLRTAHLAEIRSTFNALEPGQTVLLFCHDPTALPFLWDEPDIRARLPQVEQTIIGHLHSNLVFWKSRLLAGVPRITFLGHTTRRFTAALRDGRRWRPFKVRLCPALAGIELTKGAGYLVALLDPDKKGKATFQFRRLPRSK